MDQPPLEQSPDQLPEYQAPLPVGAYDQHPSHYYGYGYPYPGSLPSPYDQPVGTNGLAKASFVLGILGFFAVTAILSAVFGGIALAQTKRTGQRGRGFAATGLSFGLAWIVLLGTLVVLGVVDRPDPAVRDAHGTVVQAGRVALFDLRAGDCFSDPNAAGAAPKAIDSVTASPCRAPHDAEAFALPAASGPDGAAGGSADYPGTAKLQADAQAACKKALGDYVFDDMSVPRSVRTVSYAPDAHAWAAGKRRFLCSLESTAALTRSLREDDTVLSADQARYLKAVGEFNREVRLIDDADPAADLATWQGLAADMAAIADREDDALTGGWPPDVQRAVDRLIARQAPAIPLYRLAAKAGTVRDVGGLLDRGMSLIDGDDAFTIRHALGLSTNQGQAPNTDAEILYG
jgi:hypothetical protein